MVVYSYTRLTNFDNCGLRYKYMYIDKSEKDFDNTIEGFMGTKVHESLEKLYKDLKYSKILTLNQLLNYYKRRWRADITDDIVVVKKDLTKKDYYKMGLKYLENYYKKHYPFDEDYTIGLEMPVEIDLFNDGKYVLKGYIDRLAIKDNTLRIHDYKTSSVLPTNEEIKENKQLALYALALKDKYDVEKIELIWHFLAFDKELKVEKTDEDYESIKYQIKEKIDHIESLKEDDFKPKPSVLCDWCQYASICPVKKHIVKTKQLSLEEFNKDYGVKLVKEYYEIKEKLDSYKLKLKELEQKIYDYANREDLNVLYGGIGKLTIYKSDKYKFPEKGSLKYNRIKEILEQNNLKEYFKIDDYFLNKAILNDLIDGKVKEQILPLLKKEEFKKIYAKDLK